ncbi:MAG TPA: DMT family transporter [Burkholderiales bacterium]|nr:DMT family transporter [Burkholderiales bacterium]
MPPSPAHRRTLPYLLLLVAAASWGGNWVAARAVTFDVPPFALSFWRWAVASAILLPFAAAQLREDAPLIRRHLPALAGFGVVGVAAFTMLGYWGLRYTTAVNATLLNSSLPLFVVPLSWWLHKLTVSGRQLAGLALSLAGVACIISAGDLQALARLALNPGDLLLLGGAFLWAIYTVLLKWRPPLQPLSFLFTIAAAAAAFTLPFYLWEMSAGGAMVVSAKTAAAIGYLGLFPSVIAYICWNRAVAEVGPNVAGFFNPVIPVFGTLFAVMFLGEPLHAYHLAGFALVLGGVVLTSRR